MYTCTVSLDMYDHMITCAVSYFILTITCTLEDDSSPEPQEDGELTLRCRQRLRSSSPGQLHLRASKVVLSRSTRMRMRVSVAVPGVSEGVLPPNAQPVTSQEALHHLANIVSELLTLSFLTCTYMYT